MDSILLSGYDAKRCARRVHNDWDPSIEKVEWEVPAALQMRFDAGNAFEADVFTQLKAALGDGRYLDLTALFGKADAVAATEQAMDNHVEVLLGGWLPDDVEGGRKGRPDLLVHVGDGCYVPGDVKGHKTAAVRARGSLSYSMLADPATRLLADGFVAQTTARFDDYLQLAHYWRMLESLGRARGSATGFIIGTDDWGDLARGPLLTWLDLEAPYFETFSRSQGRTKRSAMQRYDHEHSFRVEVARTSAAGEPALVEPVFIEECDSCPWHEHCRSVAGQTVASAHITQGRLSIREWNALKAATVLSLSELADLDVDEPGFQAAYLPEVTHLKDPLARVATAVRRARMLRDGRTLERETTGPIYVPRAAVEIDFDIEWDVADHVYLWGALVRRPGEEPTYHAVVSWDDLGEGRDVELATEFAVWLRAEIAAADAAGHTLLVYHYSNPEPAYLHKLLGADAVTDLTERFVDLLPIVREHYFGVHGLGIKKVAPAFGFEWRDEDPGGLQSQLWLIEARSAPDPHVREGARTRVLTYNEDDVRATAALREGLSVSAHA